MEQVNSLKTGKKFKKTEIGEIPVDWEIQELKDIADEVYRYPTYYNIEYYEKGVPEVRGELIKANGTLDTDLSKYRFIRPTTSDKFPRTQLREGDLVLSVRGTMGKVAIVPEFLERANMTANLIRIAPCRRKIYPVFLLQLLINEKFQNILNVASSSTTIKTIKAPELKSIKFPIPPLSEQKKITEILTTVDTAIEKSAQVIKKTKELKRGLIQQLLTRGISHTKFKKTEIGEIPVDWKAVKVKDVCEKPEYGYTKSATEKKIGPKFLRITDIQNGKVLWNSVPYSECPDFLKRKYLLKPGDILFARTGATTGKSYLVKDCPEAVFASYLIRIITKGEIESKYLYFVFNSSIYWRQIAQQIGGSAQGGVNASILSNIKIPYPSLPEQKKIAEILSSVDEEIEKEIADKEAFEKVKKGLMQVLLTGKMRVRI